MTDHYDADSSRGESGATGRTTRRTFLRATGAGLLAAGAATSSSSAGVSAASDSFVETDGTEFVIDGEAIYFSGSNNFWLMDTYYGTPELHDTVFSLYDRLGLNFVRTWGFKDGTSEHGPMLQPQPGEYNEEAFRRFDSLVAKAGEYGIRLVLPLVNNWEEYGGKGQYVEWVDSASGADEFYTNEECRQLYRDYVEQVLTRENTITGVEYRNDPTIAVWELANEPRAPNLQNSVEAMGDWIAEMSAHLTDLAPDQLVSTGMEGFYADSDHGNGYGYNGSDGTDYVAHHQFDTVDVCSYHMYPIAWGKTAEWGIDWISQHQTDAEETIGKPGYLGEFGLSLQDVSSSQRDQYFRDYYDALDQHDADGALIWQVDRGTRDERVGDSQPTHGIYTDDTETLDIVRDYTSIAREKSAVALEPNAPRAPTGVALTGRTASSIDVVWNATTGWGAGAGHYAVTLDGQEVATVSAEETATTVTDLEPGTTYDLAVQAVDVDGATSDSSAVATLSTLPSDTSTTTDPCEDTSVLAESSDLGSLTTDTTNAEYFNRPDGSTDGARLNRSAQEDVAMVYAVDEQLLDMAVEYHAATSQGGTAEYYESTDGGDSWQQIEVARSTYDSPGSGGWSNQLHSKTGFSAEADMVKIVLTGGSAAWAPQIGNVKLVTGAVSDPTPVGPGADARDLNDDGVYEDVNGNGERDYDDVVQLFDHMEEFENPGRFDVNGNDEVDFDDVVDLFQQI